MLLILRLKTKYIVGFFIEFFLSQIPAKYFTKFRLFHQKQHAIGFFSPLINFAGSAHPKTTNTIFVD